MKPAFISKSKYLAWRSEWRLRYAQLTVDIRDMKMAHRATASGLDKDKWNSVRPRIIQAVARCKKTSKINPLYWSPTGQLFRDQSEARQMLEWRKESKVLAQQQFLTERSAGIRPATPANVQ